MPATDRTTTAPRTPGHGALAVLPGAATLVRTRINAAAGRAVLRGVTLAAPQNQALARDIGLAEPPAPPVAEATPTRPLPATLGPASTLTLQALGARTAPAQASDLAEATGAQVESVRSALALLLKLGMVARVGGRGTSNDPYMFVATDTGRAWRPITRGQITDEALIDAVRTINDSKPTAHSGAWWRGSLTKYEVPDKPPASVSTVCDLLVNAGRKRADLAVLRQRLDALAEAGLIDAVPISRPRGYVNFYWARPARHARHGEALT